MRIFLVSDFLPEITQQIHSLRASGVMSPHMRRAFGVTSSAIRKSLGMVCTTPSAIFVLFIVIILPNVLPSHDRKQQRP